MLVIPPGAVLSALRAFVTAAIVVVLLAPAAALSNSSKTPARGANATTLEHDETRPATIWQGAGAFVWHETDVAPEALGRELRRSGFSWVAVLVHEGTDLDPLQKGWVERVRAVSGLAVGAWGVLRTRPDAEAELADRLVREHSLDFYIANAEAEYKYTGDDGQSRERYERSRRFAERFRALAPDVPAAVSSYCRADTQDLDWAAWREARFVFLPQAYVNDFGSAATPAACAKGALPFFDADAIHPTVGMYTGQDGAATVRRYAELLADAGTLGFSVYLAETRMESSDWRAFGQAIEDLAIARKAPEMAVMPRARRAGS
jgi:hypothetical protein